MPGMVTTLFQLKKVINTSRRLSHPGRYCTTPQGYIASGDGYTQRFDEIAADFPNKTKRIDDTCMWSDSIAECFFQACEWLNLCGSNGIVLNPEKFVFAQDIVEFAGFDITLDEVKPCRKYIDAIHQFPTPQNITDIRSWFGLVHQVSYYTSMTEKMCPFRDLLKPKTPFCWDNQLQQIFDECKRSIINDIQHRVTIFDKTRKTCLTTDWLKGSCFTHPTESRYAPIEGKGKHLLLWMPSREHVTLFLAAVI